MTTIAEHVDELHAAMATQVPAEAMAAFGRDLERFAAMELPATIATVGDRLPSVTVLDAEGNEVALASLFTHDRNVIVIYRGAWCPYCNLTLRAYENDLVPELTARGAGLIAITVQKPEGLEAMRESNALSFGAYSDHTGAVIDALGIWTSPSDEVAAIQEQFDLKVPEMSVEGSYRVPMPTTLIVDRDGVIRFIDVHPNFSTRTEVADILEGLSA